MKYAVIKCSNEAFAIDSEWSDLIPAKVQFHSVCKTLWNSADVIAAKVMIVDEQLNCIDNCREFIYHEVEQEQEPETDTEE